MPWLAPVTIATRPRISAYPKLPLGRARWDHGDELVAHGQHRVPKRRVGHGREHLGAVDEFHIRAVAGRTVTGSRACHDHSDLALAALQVFELQHVRRSL